ncbi:PREDICTED: uncharacterized protein LOC106118575 [Papilio xuthus]|uniref:Uncharacterized protein LOC106118575 n=1 Tax=Papilio xuthus TaxID=66420 RepID=A0AAJ6ZAT7_PAPXU|nr:PREDICTED: uncharacterized protein LOC106118575 [Papilio xuthus]
MNIAIFVTLLCIVGTSTSKATLQHLSDKVATHIKTLTEKAASTIHKLATDIDPKKLEQLDLLQIFTKKLAKKPHPELVLIDPYQVDRLKYYFEHAHGLKKPVSHTPIPPIRHPPPVPHKQYGIPH